LIERDQGRLEVLEGGWPTGSVRNFVGLRLG
jgi:hypothetical protein